MWSSVARAPPRPLNGITYPDESVTIRFGGDENALNHIAVMPGWNYTVRLYRLRKETLEGTWKFPEAQPDK